VALRSAAISLLALLSVAAPAHGERLPVRTFTTADGLANDVVNRIVGDSRGYLWFCTREGLSRFDGHGFTTYGIDDGLPSAVIYDLVETRQGIYWIATFVEMNGDVAGVSCGSATISGLGHVAEQCIAFDACGVNCHERTNTFDDGSTLLILESVVDVITYGNSAGFLEITQTISGGSGRFEGATGSGTGVVNLNALAVIIASGDITLPDE
jgi:ligand-binding sensor domain-containing protein